MPGRAPNARRLMQRGRPARAESAHSRRPHLGTPYGRAREDHAMPTAELAVASPRDIRDHASDVPVLPPGPRGPALLNGIRLLVNPNGFLEECARRFGDVFTVRFPASPPHVLFTDNEAVREIMTADPGDLRAGEANAELGPLLGWNSLLVLDGARHLRERRLMLPPFHGERMVAYGHAMRDITSRALDALPLGRKIRFHPVL